MPKGIYVRTEETKRKNSEAHIGMYAGDKNPMFGVHRFGAENPNYGNHCSEITKEKIRKVHIELHPSIETREKMSASGKGRIFSDEHKRKLREQNISRTGQHHSEETRLKISLALKGKTTCWLGRHHSEETKRKLSEQHKGMKYPDESNLKKGHKGSSHSNWRGGITPENVLIRASIEYKKWQIAVFIRDNYICQKCGAKNGEGQHIAFNAHHVKSFSKYPKLRLEVSNGITLCKSCHEIKGLHKGMWHKELVTV